MADENTQKTKDVEEIRRKQDRGEALNPDEQSRLDNEERRQQNETSEK